MPVNMNSSIKAIIFDFGGVVINWDPRRVFRKYFPGDEQALEKFMVEIGFMEWNLRQDEGYPFEQAVVDLSAQFPQYAHIIKAYDTEWEQSITGIVPETVDLLRRLKAAGNHLYGLTNWNHAKFTLVRHKFEFFSLFEEIVISGEVKLAKPDPAIYRLLLGKIGLSAQDCLMVDDTVRNVEASRKLGFETIHYLSPDQLEAEFKRLGVL
jgi:2-haloacid dehalogenase